MSRKKRRQKLVKEQNSPLGKDVLSRRLTQGLLFSGALNIALATSLIYFAVRGKEEPRLNDFSTTTSCSSLVLDMSKEASLQTVLEDYSHLNFEQLVLLLKDSREVLQGFSQRDLALSVLVHFHDLDIQRAVSGQSLKTSLLTFYTPKEEQISLYSDLSEQAYKHILSFLKIEQWPYTSEGLFKRWVNGQRDESLKKAFYLTKEFMLLEALFSPTQMDQNSLLSLLEDGPWSLIKNFTDSKPLVQNFSNALRIKFLAQYLDFASKLAADWILAIDPAYALEKLSDDRVVALISLLEKKTPLNENFLLHLALKDRSDWVKQEACRILFHYCDKNFVEPFNLNQALKFLAMEYNLEGQKNFTSIETDLQEVSKPHEPYSPKLESIHYYVVQKGDCLSKIAKMHDVDLRILKKANHLDNDLIQVGMTLIIP